MSLTRLAGAWSSAAFFENRTLPWASRRSTASALSGSGRALWLTAHEGPVNASDRTMARRRRAGTFPLFYLRNVWSPNKRGRQAQNGQRTARLSSLDGLKRGDRPATTFIGWP